MKLKFMKLILLILVFCLSFSWLVLAANNNYILIGSFQLEGNRAIKINSRDYVPLEEVARVLDCKNEWEREKTRIYGHLNYQDFESDVFLIAYGYLYLPLEQYKELFDIKITIRGNKYYIYINEPYAPPINHNLKLDLQTDKDEYRRNEPIAVSLLLLNEVDRSYTLRYNTSKRYDLILKRYNREIWRLSDDNYYLQDLSIEILKKGDYRLFTVLIEPGKDRYLSSADYTLEAEIITANGITIRGQVEIEIYSNWNN